MSTTTQALPQADIQAPSGEETESGRRYRGRSVAELIPRIQADLGPGAIVLSRRSGMEGGIGGFFQRPFVEIEAREGSGGIDLYDGTEETPQLDQLAGPDADAFANALAAAGIAVTDARIPEPKAAAAPVAAFPAAGSYAIDAYETSSQEPAPAPAPSISAFEPAIAVPAAAVPAPDAPVRPAPAVPAPDAPANPAPAVPAPDAPANPAPAVPASESSPITADDSIAATRTRTQLAIVKELTDTGIEERFALELIDAASAHVLPFNPRIGLRAAVKIELQRRIPTAPPLPSRGAAIVLAGPGGSGKTRSIDLLASIYERAQGVKTSCATLLCDGHDGSVEMTLSPAVTTPIDAASTRAARAFAAARAEGIALIDTPSISPADQSQIKALGKLLGALKADRVVVALPATLGAKAASQLLAAAKPIKPNAIAITHADETDQIGVAVQVACESGLAPEYMLSAGAAKRSLVRLDAAGIAERLLR